MICTTHCVNCGKPANAGYTGHVHDGSKTITSGWCKECVSKGIHWTHTGLSANCKKCFGCDGDWEPKMGIEVRE